MKAMSIVAFLPAVFVEVPPIVDAQTKVLPAVDIPASAIQERLRPRKRGGSQPSSGRRRWA